MKEESRVKINISDGSSDMVLMSLNFEHWLPVKKPKSYRTDPDQTASKEAVLSGSSLFAILTSIL